MKFPNDVLGDNPPPASPLKREGWSGLSFDRNCHQWCFPEAVWAALVDEHQERHPGERLGIQHVSDAQLDLPPELLPARVDAIQQYLLADGFFLSDCYLFSLSRDWGCRIDQDMVLIAGVRDFVDAVVVKAGGRDHVLSQMYLDFDPDEADSGGLRRYVRDLLNDVRSEE